MGEGWLITDGAVETVSAFEVLAEETQRLTSDPYRWKWAIIALHSGLQGAMVLALQGSHGLHTLREEDAKRWLDAYEKGGPYPGNLKLDCFPSLYKKIKSDKMLKYADSRKFVPKGTQGSSIKLLNRLRNEYIHFTPRVWALDLIGLPAMALDCIDIAEFLVWGSHNVIWREEGLGERMARACPAARTHLTSIIAGEKGNE
ncbi:MAG: hypothetical protein A4E57_02119 [Syntrophorhabdaceae bacterium PtaU1.Bin034]|jgi:hypothetical protein|nr:MAG: hypothetical protein A4E57_02119 [Syntrophorhabdaceae bacterium PtaU1.Bin034]